jgi:hypothetical protein
MSSGHFLRALCAYGLPDNLGRVRMHRQAIVTVLFDAMVAFARLSLRIDMNNYKGKVFKMV